jgi:integrase
LHSISIREIEHFLSKKKLKASEWMARKYYGSLASAFEKAVQWNILMEILSGLKLVELIALQWNDIDLTLKVIFVKNSETFTTKTRKNRVVPMNEELFRLLNERKANIRFKCENVFHNKYGGKLLETTVSRYFKQCVISAGINNKLHFHSFDIHSLRH